jgi:anti-anti-sigma factor
MRVSACARPTISRTVLVVSGDLDAASGGVFQESLLRAARTHGSPLLLDLSGVDFVDCAGLTALITIRRLIEARNCGLRIIDASRAVHTIVGLTGTQYVLDEIPRTFAVRGDPTPADVTPADVTPADVTPADLGCSANRASLALPILITDSR